MARGAHAVLVCILLLTTSRDGWAAPRGIAPSRVGPAVTAATEATPPAERSGPTIAWSIDFADYAGGSMEEWLHTKGFRLEHGAEDPDALALSHHAGALVFEAKQPVRGFVVHDQVKLAAFSTVRITWGIIKYPTGASYARRVNNEALMVYISFGEDNVPKWACPHTGAAVFYRPLPGARGTTQHALPGEIFSRGRPVCVCRPSAAV